MPLQPLMVGYHGCDYRLAIEVASTQQHLKPSINRYDWLGNGVYFWEDDCKRALNWAAHVKEHPQQFHYKIEKPFVLGALISPRNCLDLTQTDSREILRSIYGIVKKAAEDAHVHLPQNEPAGRNDEYLLKRNLDCFICNFISRIRKLKNEPDFDVLRAPFLEGGSLYEGSAFKDKTHTQLCVRDNGCIVGYFIPSPLREHLPHTSS